VQTMEGHSHNVATVCCHPELPIIMSGSEDGTLKIWPRPQVVQVAHEAA
jgi:coatomer subunit beta'